MLGFVRVLYICSSVLESLSFIFRVFFLYHVYVEVFLSMVTIA